MPLSADQLNTIYQNVLGRNVDSSGLAFFANRTDISDAQVRQQIELSGEANTLVTPIVRLYQEVLGRVPDAAGLKFFSNALRGGASIDSITQSFLNSSEFTSKTSASGVVDPSDLSNTNQLVTDAFQAILGRAPGASEFAYFQGRSAANILSIISTSNEATQTNAAAVTTFLDSAAVGTPNTGSLNSQTGANGGTNAGTSFVLTTGTDALVGTASNDTFRADNTTLQVTDSIRGNGGTDTFSYTDTSTTGTPPAAASISGVANINIRNLSASGAVAPTAGTRETDTVTFGGLADGQNVTLNGRTVAANGGDLTASQVQQAYLAGSNAGIPNAVVSGTFGTTYTLQTGPNANSAVLTATTNGNQTPDLTLTGTGAGNSTLAIQQGTADNAGSGGSQNADTVAAGNFTGAVNFNSDNSISAVAFTGLTAGQSIGEIGNGTTANGAVSGTYVTAATAAAINIAGGTTAGAITVTGPGITSETITSTGANNVVSSITNAVTTKNVTINASTNLDTGTGIANFATGGTLTVAGSAASVKLGSNALDAGLTSVDASGLTAGGVTATLNASAVNGFTFKGGAGNDTVTVTNAFSGTIANGAIDAGGGTGDVINVATAPLSATTGAAFANFEILRNSVAGTQNASVVAGITGVQANVSGAGFSNLTAAQAANVQVLVTDANATFSLADASGTADTLNLRLAPLAATANATVINTLGLKVAGFENVALNVGSGLQSIYSSGTTLGTIDAVTFDGTVGTAPASLKTIAISGAYAANVDATNANALTSIDAGQNTAGVVITTPGAITNALAITGSGVADQIIVSNFSSAGSIGAINAGGGNDLIKIAQASIVATTSISGGAGTDTLEISDSGAVTIVDATFQNVSQVEKIVLDATTSLNFVVGGYANAVATGNGGVLDVTAANGGSTINAQGLTGTNKLVLNLTDTGADTITTSLGGADSIKISGNHAAAAITINGANNTAGVTIDTSGSTTSSGASAFTTGSGNDSIKVGNFTATITTGTGSDSIDLTSATTSSQTINLNTSGVSSTTNPTSITGFTPTASATTDKLDFATTDQLTSATLSNGFTVTNGVATKANATVADFTAAVAASTAAGSVAFQFGNDTYVGYADGSSATNGTDHIVKLVGLTGITAVAANTTAATTIDIV